MKPVKKTGHVGARSFGGSPPASTTPPGGDSGDGNFECCQCARSVLTICAESAVTFPRQPGIEKPEKLPYVNAGSITHYIRITSADGFHDVELILDCTEIECKTIDLTGTFAGTVDIGVVTYGNHSGCCVPVCGSSPNPSQVCSTGTFVSSNLAPVAQTVSPDNAAWSTLTAEATFVSGYPAGISAGGGSSAVDKVEDSMVPSGNSGTVNVTGYVGSTLTVLEVAGVMNDGDVLKVTITRNDTSTNLSSDYTTTVHINATLVHTFNGCAGTIDAELVCDAVGSIPTSPLHNPGTFQDFCTTIA